MTTAVLESATVFRTERVKHLLAELDALTFENTEPGRRLSIYLPAGRMPEDAEQARTRLRNAVGTLRERLSEEGGRSSEIQAFLRSLESFAHGRDTDFRFWNSQLGGLAILGNPDGIRILEVPKRFNSAMYFSTHWHLTPLLELGANVDSYWCLALSQNQVKLFRGSRLGIREISLPNTPQSFAESESRVAQGHGHDPEIVKPEADRANLKRFFSRIDKGVNEAIKDSGAPLILAGVEFYLPLYRDVCSHAHLSDEIISGNPEPLQPEALHRQASRLLKHDFLKSRKRELIKIREKMECDLVHTEIDKVLGAALEGRVASLVAPSDRVRWGRFNSNTRTTEFLPETDIRGRDLYQQAAELTLLHGGELFYIESAKMPRGRPLCAELRY